MSVLPALTEQGDRDAAFNVLRPEQSPADTRGLNTLEPDKLDPMIIRDFVRTGGQNETRAFVEKYICDLGGVKMSDLLGHYIVVSARINAELALRELGCEKDEYIKRVPQPSLDMDTNALKEYLVKVLETALDIRDNESLKMSGDIVACAVRYIDKNYHDTNISLNSVANAISISYNYLSVLFGQKLGISFSEYLTQKRMTRAKQLLCQSSMQSREIAYAVGYNSLSYFSYVFKKTQGCTPGSYRDTLRMENWSVPQSLCYCQELCANLFVANNDVIVQS